MVQKEISSGGASFSGYIYQTLYAILLCMEDEKWDRIKIEPVSSKEQIDILLLGSNSLSGEEKYYKKIQVKKRKDSVSEKLIREWVNRLIKDDDAENYELCLFGHVAANKKYQLDSNVKVYDNDISNVETKVRKAIEHYCKELKARDFNKRDLDIAYCGLFTLLAKNSMEKNSIGKEQIHQELEEILKYSVDNCAAYIKNTSKRRFYENPIFGRDLSPKRLDKDGQTLIKAEKLPRLSDDEFPKVLIDSSESSEKDNKCSLFAYFENKAKDEESLKRHIYLSATSGGGKSTYLYGMWERYLNEENCIPIYLSLTDIKSIKEKVVDSYLFYAGIDKFEWLKFAFAESKYYIILLLDGYNEISDAADNRIKGEIEDILGIEKVTVIVTSRNPKSPFAEGAMTELKLCDLEREQIKAFLGGNEDNLPKRNYEGMLTNPFMLEVCIETFAGRKGGCKNINQVSLAEIFKKYIDKQITNMKLSPIDQIYIKVLLPLVAMKLDERRPRKKDGIAERIQKDSKRYNWNSFKQAFKEVQSNCSVYENLMDDDHDKNEDFTMSYPDLIKKEVRGAVRMVRRCISLELFRADSEAGKEIIWDHEFYRDYFVARGYAIYCAYNDNNETCIYNLAKQINYRYPEPDADYMNPKVDAVVRGYHMRKVQMFIDMVDAHINKNKELATDATEIMKETAVYRRLTRDAAFVYEDLDDFKMAEAADLSFSYYSEDPEMYDTESQYDYPDKDRRYADAAYSFSGLGYNWGHVKVPKDKKKEYLEKEKKALDIAKRMFEYLEEKHSSVLNSLTVRDDMVKMRGNLAAYYSAISEFAPIEKKEELLQRCRELHEENLVERKKIKEIIHRQGKSTEVIDKNIAQTYTGIATANFKLGNYRAAIEDNIKAIDIRPEEYTLDKFTSYRNIVGGYGKLKEHNELMENEIVAALEWIKKAFIYANEKDIDKFYDDMNNNTDTIISGLTEKQSKKYQTVLDQINHERKIWSQKNYMQQK